MTNAKGKLIKVTSSVSTTEYTSFDILGRVQNHKQRTDNNDYTTAYTYNLSGALIEETYPSGRVVKNTLDADGDLALVQSSKSNVQGLKMYANAFTYTSAGAVSSLRLGNGKFENTTFNSRLQPIQIGLGSSATSQNLLKLNFDYGTTDNNGNVKSQTITTPTIGTATGFTALQTYSYDSLNRLKDAKEMIGTSQQWKQTFKFDRYGNRNFDTANGNTTTLANGCPTNICNPTANPIDNKLVGTNYDSVGNTSQDANGQTFVYDAENKQVQVNNSSGIVGQYWYNGDGQRVKKYVPSTQETTIFVYDASGKMVAEYSTIVANQAEAKINYITTDHLGSPRINTDANGQVISRHDYMPFGEEIQSGTGGRMTTQGYAGNDGVKQQFTGYERDTETDLDFAQARMYNKNHGRFNSVDPTLGSLKAENPQTLNRYTYALNNPLAYIDPDGREPLVVGNWSDLSKDQQRLFQTYIEKNYAEALKSGSITAESLWNVSATVANGLAAAGPNSNLLNQSQLTTFLGTTSMLEKRGVIGELASVTTINGDTKEHEFRIFGELKDAKSVGKIEKAFDNGGLWGSFKNKVGEIFSEHGDYSISRREQSPGDIPNGQVSRIPETQKVDVDVDYRNGRNHLTRANSDIRADDGNTSHYRRHVERYGPIPALTPRNPTFIKRGGN